MKIIYKMLLITLLLISISGLVMGQEVATSEKPNGKSIAGIVTEKTNENSKQSPAMMLPPRLKHKIPKNATSSPSVPESDMATIIVTEEWLLQNSKSPDSDNINITFPREWINNPRLSVGNQQDTVKLRLPKTLMESLNKKSGNSNPYMVSISLWKNVLLGELPDEAKTVKTINTTFTPGTKWGDTGPAYQMRSEYSKRLFVGDVTSVDGLITPTSYYNPNQQAFTNYNELEIYLGWVIGDVIEVIGDFEGDGRAYVWAAVYDRSVSYSYPATEPLWTLVDVSSHLRPIYYQVILDGSRYKVYFFDWNDGGWRNGVYTDSTPSTTIDWLEGSAELGLNGVPTSFSTQTDVHVHSVTTSGSYQPPGNVFDWWRDTSDEQYVYLYSSVRTDNTIDFHEYAGNQY